MWLEKIHAALKRREQDLIDVMVGDYGGTRSSCSMIPHLQVRLHDGGRPNLVMPIDEVFTAARLRC